VIAHIQTFQLGSSIYPPCVSLPAANNNSISSVKHPDPLLRGRLGREEESLIKNLSA